LQNAGVTDTQAKLVNGQIKFVDSNGNESPNVLVKDDGSLLFSALNEIEYMPLSKIDNTNFQSLWTTALLTLWYMTATAMKKQEEQ